MRNRQRLITQPAQTQASPELHAGAPGIMQIILTPKMRMRQAFFKVLHLIRLRKLWSQCGALLQISGRRSFFLRVLDMIRICPRRSHRRWTLRQCWSYLGPIIRRHAAAFRHLHSRFGHLQYRSRPMERNFRRIVMAQIDANGWWNWCDLAVKSRRYLGQNIDQRPY